MRVLAVLLLVQKAETQRGSAPSRASTETAMDSQSMDAAKRVTFIPPITILPTMSSQNPAHDGRVCSTWGDFHYKTFDGDVFRFPGLCNYVFSAHCGAAYEDFNIQLRRGLVGSRPTITHVILKTQGLVLEASNGSLLINGRREELPYSSTGLLVEQSSVYINIRVRLVLTFMWNREDSALLELDPKYANQTCGLCGDFNGLPAVNEFYVHNARLTPLQFGNLQKLDGPTEQCQDPLPSPASNCTDGEGVCRRTLLGPALAQCNALVDPDEYETACIQDLCRCPTCPCATFAEYSRQCAHAGGQPQNWRGPDLCPQTCPGNMQHRECGSPCADTCSNPGRAQLCEDHCVDGCFCPPGTVLDDVTHTGCLPLAQCPCSHGGHPYAPGTSFSTACSSCTCSAGLWQCQDLPCPGTCSVQGGSHISTYDEKLYDVHGDCNYILSKKCADSDFTVLAELRKCGLTDNENCLKAVTLNVTRGSMAIRIQANGGVFMNSIYTQLPVSAAGVTVFRPTSFFVLVETGLGLQLQVQLVPFLQVVIRLDPSYHGQMCGLCGNFNQNQADDFRTLSGVVEGTAAAFANTWKTQAACPNMKNSFEDPCSLSVENENYAQHWCSLLTDPAGAFSPCHSTVDPAPFHMNCMFDTCNCEKSEDCMCAALSSYVRACAVKGVLLRGWRAGACAKYMSSCPKSQSYTYVADGCQPTCHSLSQADITCGIAFVPVDGCTCAHGTFLDEAGACVPAEACPCYHRGSTVAPGEVVHDNGVVCSCVRGKLSCLGAERLQSTGCVAPMMYLDCSNASAGTPGAECLRSCHTLDVGCFSSNCVSGCVCPPGLVSDGSGGCVAEEDCPCLHNEAAFKPGETIRVDCNTCTCRNRRWECSRRACLATCAAYGDGHFITFDGARYSFSGDCEYTLAQDHCGGNGTANGTFRIVTENVPCGTTGVTCSKAIKLFLESYELILREGSYKVVQREPGADPPYKVRYMGNYLAIETRSGVVVSWDRKTSVFIRLHQDYKGRICGLCGNFDGNAVNDFTTRSQSVVGDVLEFGNSWKFSPSCPDALVPRDPCTANPYRKAWAQKQCSIVHSTTFATCHSQVDSTKYYEACVRDACACDSGGDCECFCTAVAAYAQACHDAGVCVSWRTPDRCPLFCDYYNPRGECEWHYQPCGAPCLRTCRNPSGRCSEDLPGLEGCYPRCPPSKPFFSEDQMKCVAQCGCYDEDGNYHDVGVRVPTAENCQRCDCTPSGLLCTHSLSACTCTYEGKAYGYHDVIYNTTDGLGACLTAVCGNNGTITRRAMECPGAPSTMPFTFTTTAAPPSTTGVAPTPSTVCVHELCLWSDWYDGGHPEPGMGGGDFETFAILRQRGYRVCPAPTSVECRAQRLPDIPLQELGQKVECNPIQGLMCLNSEQSPPLCHNYELRVLCCDYVPCSPAPGVTTQQPLLTSLVTPAQTTSRPGTSLWPTRASPSQTRAPKTTSTGSTAPSPKPSPTISATVTPTTSAVTTATSPSTISLTGPQATEPGTQRRSSPGVTMAPSTTSMPSLSRGQTSPASSLHPSYVHTLVTSSMGSPTSPGFTKATALGTSPSVLPTHSTRWGTSGGTLQHPTSWSVTTRTSTAHSALGTLAGTPGPPALSTMHTRTSTPRAEMPTATAHITGGQGTTACQPRCEWTEWFDVDFPTSGVTGGDVETYDNIRATGARMCPDPEKIECRAENYPEVSIDQIGQVLNCSLDMGLVCRNEDQRGEFNMCFNYNIRVLCCDDVRHCPRLAPGSTAPTAPVHSSPTGTTRLPEHLSSAVTQRQLTFPSAPPVTTLLTSGIRTTTGSPLTGPRFGTTQPSGTLQTSSTKLTLATSSSTGCMPRCAWTDWFDEDYPTPGPNGGDFETFAVFRSAGHVFCEHPQDIECRSERAPQMALEDVGQVVQCNLSFGLVCRNREQPGPVPYCHNFHVRLLCCDSYSHCLSTPGTTEGPSPSPGTASTSVTPPTRAISPAHSLPFIWASQTSTGLPSTVPITISGPSPSLETASTHTTPSTRATSHAFSLPWALQTSTGLPSMAPNTTSGPSPSLKTTSILPPITVSSTGPSIPATVSPTAFLSSAFPTGCFCQAFGQIFSPGDVVYNKTDRAGCHFYAVCNQRCDIDRFEGACPTSSPPETSSPEPPPSLSPGCNLVVPRRQVNETWTLEDCTVARCEGDNRIILLEPRQVANISCVNGHVPVKVLSEAEPCDYHLECECSCSGWGGSHYRTFDGTAYSFLHNCTYVLMREINPRHGNLRILLSNHYCGADSCARALMVHHKSMEVVLTTTPGPSGQKSLIMFDHTPVSHGYSKNGVRVSLMGTTAMAIDIPAIRVGITFDGSIFQVRLPYSHFSYNTEGQCGTCTNSQADDCRRPDGTMAPTCQDMARTWLVPESREAGCWAPTSLPPTTGSPSTVPTSAPCPRAPLCELLLSRVFAECHSLIPPSPFLSACVSDSCQADRPEVPCQSLEAYASLCRARGVCSDWRNATGGLCDFTCPPAKVYRPCGPVQPETCEPRGQSPPSRGLAEGCFCPDGSVLFSSNADVCVPQCPCVGPDGFPKFPGEQWVSNCQTCVCDKGSMSVRCTPVRCQDQAPPPECSQAGFVTVTRPLDDNPCCLETLCVCNRTTCPHSPPQCRLGEELTHTEEEGGCCPTFHCQPKLCTYNGTSYGIGATFPAVLPCHTCKCLTVDAQDPAVQCARDTCNSTCPQGFKYSWVSGHCCGECVQVACPTPDGRLVQPNETWVNSLVDNCTEYHCEAKSGRPVLTARPTPCPEVSRCRGILRKTGCCYSCEEVDSCQVRVNRMVLRHQSCATQVPVNVTFCEGSCPGASRYSMDTQAMQPQCTCCRETRAHEEAVTMQCPDGTALQHTYTHVDQCSCTPSCGPLPKAPEGSAPTSLT
ncbi:Mucin-5B [Manis javanica]|nr:Mucin-5B [Manis javanica]